MATIAARNDGTSAPGRDLPPPTLRTIDALQALRAAAALLVVIDHALISAANGGLIDPAIGPLAASLGYLGVCVFFTISGFVMIASHGADFARTRAPRHFLVRRMVRLLPLHWISTIATAALRPEFASPSTLIFSLLLIPHQPIEASFGKPLFEPAWTLQYELFFYVLFAIALWLSFRAGVALLTLSLIGAVVASLFGWFGQANALAYLTEQVLLFFVAGLGLGCLRRILPDRYKLSFELALLVAGAALVTCAIGIAFWGAQSLRVMMMMVAAPVIAVAACGLSGTTSPPTAVRRACRALGDAAYAMYMVHPFIVFPMGAFLARNPAGLHWSLFLLAAIAVSIAVGLAVYQWVEKGLVKMLGRRLGQNPNNGGRTM